MTRKANNPELFSPLSLWVRNHPQLESSISGAALSITDIDFVVHKYATDCEDKLGKRDVQYLMFVEGKSNWVKEAIGKVFPLEIPEAQRDTLGIVSQVMHNVKNKDPRSNGQFSKGHRKNHSTFPAWSEMHKRWILIKCYGVHSLILSGNDPDDSEWMFWDRKPIYTDELLKIFRFDLNPHTLKPLETRRRKKAENQLGLLFDNLE